MHTEMMATVPWRAAVLAAMLATEGCGHTSASASTVVGVGCVNMCMSASVCMVSMLELHACAA